jgi:hypothetical protein
MKSDHKERIDKRCVLRHEINYLQICSSFFKVLGAKTNGRQGKIIILNTSDSNNVRTNGITQGGHDILWPGYMRATAQVVLIDQLRPIYTLSSTTDPLTKKVV